MPFPLPHTTPTPAQTCVAPVSLPSCARTPQGAVKELRLLTKPDGSSKGCAFVEFHNGDMLRKALKLHHSTIPGHGDRKINVELTAGGKGARRARAPAHTKHMHPHMLARTSAHSALAPQPARTRTPPRARTPAMRTHVPVPCKHPSLWAREGAHCVPCLGTLASHSPAGPYAAFWAEACARRVHCTVHAALASCCVHVRVVGWCACGGGGGGVGGGTKSAFRQQKIKERNERLAKQRKVCKRVCEYVRVRVRVRVRV
jgi:hypothetical protein